MRYITIDGCPDRIQHVRGYSGGKALNRNRWRASNLFSPWAMVSALSAWSHAFTLDEVPPGSYLAVAINGIHGVEGAYAALRVGITYVGATRRAPSFPSNTWECPVRRTDRNTTYFIPLSQEMLGQELEVVVLNLGSCSYSWESATGAKADLHPEVWITVYPVPYKKVEIK